MGRDWLTAAEILPYGGGSLPSTVAGLKYLIDREGWRDRPLFARPRFGRGGGWEYHVSLLPADVRARIAASELEDHVTAEAAAQSRALWSAYERLPQGAKDKALRRQQAVAAVEAFGAAGSRQMAVVHVAREFGVSTSTLWEWIRIAQSVGRHDRLPALAPRSCGRTTTAAVDPRAWDFLVADYLREEFPSFDASHRRMLRAAAGNGWSPIPSAKTLKRRIEREFPASVRALAREGVDGLKRMLPSQRRDRSVFHAIQAVNADGHIFDVRVQWEDGMVGRPVLVAFQDIYSGTILSHRICRTENKELVRLALADLVERWGVPEIAYFDNGRHFASKWLTGQMTHRFRFKVRDEEPQGILKALGIEVHFTTPYHGQSKPIERAFRDLAEDIAKHPSLAGAYTGNSPVTKPANYGSKAAPIGLFRELVAAEIAAHNARPGRRGATTKGRSLLQTLEDSLQQASTLIRRASSEQRRMLLLAAEGVTARRPTGEIVLEQSRYWAEELPDRIGEKLIVRFDPQNLAAPIAVYTLDNRFVCEAEPIGDVAFNSVDDARAWARINRDRVKAVKAQLEAERRLDTAALAQMLPQPSSETPAAPKVVRLVNTNSRRAASDWDADDDFSRGVAMLADGQVVPFARHDDSA